MDTKRFDMGEIDIAWCPGCGNFAILNALKQALSDWRLDPRGSSSSPGSVRRPRHPTTTNATYSWTSRAILAGGNRY